MNALFYMLSFITCIVGVAGAVNVSYNLGHKHGRQFVCTERSYACKCCRGE